VPVSVGEILDKISILEIKEVHIKDAAKLENIKKEKSALQSVCDKEKISYQDSLFQDLKGVNQELWIIEDDIRLKEKSKEFDEEFIRLARAVYVTNDKRFECKSRINNNYGSVLREEKSYEDYS
jgi:hypothetical protein